MPSDLTVSNSLNRSRPDDALLIITNRGDDKVRSLKPGTRLLLTVGEAPGQTIRAEVVEGRSLIPYLDFGGYGRHPGFWRYPEFGSFGDFGSWEDSFNRAVSAHALPDRQRFRIEFPYATESGSAAYSAAFLAEQVIPVVTALAAIQLILYGWEPSIHAISHNSPVTIDTSGAGNLYDRISADVIPWKRKHAQEIAAHDAACKAADIEKKRAEVAAADAMKDRELAEAEEARQIARQARAQADLLESNLTKARFDLALHIVKSIEPDLPIDQIYQRVAQLGLPLLAITGAVDVMPVANDNPTQDSVPTLP